MNYGQLVLEVERCAAGRAPTVLVPHMGGTVHHPEEILQAILDLRVPDSGSPDSGVPAEVAR